MTSIVTVLAALGQQTRLDVLTLLARAPEDGMTSGDLALSAGVPANSMSTHLAVLDRAGLVIATRRGRQAYYRMDREAVEAALGSLSARLVAPSSEKYSVPIRLGTMFKDTTSGAAVLKAAAGSWSVRSGLRYTIAFGRYSPDTGRLDSTVQPVQPLSRLADG